METEKTQNYYEGRFIEIINLIDKADYSALKENIKKINELTTLYDFYFNKSLSYNPFLTEFINSATSSLN
jgi:hypothetical protein